MQRRIFYGMDDTSVRKWSRVDGLGTRCDWLQVRRLGLRQNKLIQNPTPRLKWTKSRARPSIDIWDLLEHMDPTQILRHGAQ